MDWVQTVAQMKMIINSNKIKNKACGYFFIEEN